MWEQFKNKSASSKLVMILGAVAVIGLVTAAVMTGLGAFLPFAWLSGELAKGCGLLLIAALAVPVVNTLVHDNEKKTTAYAG